MYNPKGLPVVVAILLRQRLLGRLRVPLLHPLLQHEVAQQIELH